MCRAGCSGGNFRDVVLLCAVCSVCITSEVNEETDVCIRASCITSKQHFIRYIPHIQTNISTSNSRNIPPHGAARPGARFALTLA